MSTNLPELARDMPKYEPASSTEHDNQTILQYKWSNKVTYGLPQGSMVQLRSWMIPAEACPGTFVTLKGACGKTTTTTNLDGHLDICDFMT